MYNFGYLFKLLYIELLFWQLIYNIICYLVFLAIIWRISLPFLKLWFTSLFINADLSILLIYFIKIRCNVFATFVKMCLWTLDLLQFLILYRIKGIFWYICMRIMSIHNLIFIFWIYRVNFMYNILSFDNIYKRRSWRYV